MTVSKRKASPDFFEDHSLDPVAAATQTRPVSGLKAKKKAGFYLSEELLERFNRRFHQMKLDGHAIDNKSALIEYALGFALDDLDKGHQSRLLAAIRK
jgi:hypothetical protein